jgi:hypothetical protein
VRTCTNSVHSPSRFHANKSDDDEEEEVATGAPSFGDPPGIANGARLLITAD